MPSHSPLAGEEGRVRVAAGAGGPSDRDAHVYAALDLGTNNCRLLVARSAADGFRVIDSFSRIVRLGEGVNETGVLGDAAIERTIGALHVCAAKISRRGANRVRGVATEACRQAGNCDSFLDRVSAETGIDFDIISGHEEALLALAGCVPLLDVSNRYGLVFDIGGGSTEITWLGLRVGEDPQVLALNSLPCGVVNFAERYGGSETTPTAYQAMVNEVVDLIRPLESACGIASRVAAGEVQMLGISGTVTTLAAVHFDLPRYDRSRVDGCWLAADDIACNSRRLAAMDYAERARHPCIKRERADLVVAGCAILEGILRTWPVSRLRVADRGLREGILLALMSSADRAAVTATAAYR